jgi:hypothetical protein
VKIINVNAICIHPCNVNYQSFLNKFLIFPPGFKKKLIYFISLLPELIHIILEIKTKE